MQTRSKQSKSRLALASVLTIAILIMAVLITSGGLGGPGVSAQVETEGPASAATGLPSPELSADATTVLAGMLAEQEILADLYQQILPSVVNIQVVSARPTQSSVPQDFPFSIPGPDMPQQGEGSGWVFDDQGHIVTNNHVIENASQITVIFYNGAWADAEVVARDPQADLAVLKVAIPEGIDAPPLSLAPAGSLKVGYTVIALGSPFGNERSMTMGIVSALGRSFPVGDGAATRYTLPDVIQTDAAINPGNSGGPLLNLAGQVVGVNFAINSPVRANSGIGFAIPVAIVERVVPALIADGVYAYPYLGISGQSVTPQVARELGLPNTLLGARVGEILRGGPSAGSGLEAGDVITALDGVRIFNFDDLVAFLVTRTQPGQVVEATALRGEEELTFSITLGQRPTGNITQARPGGDGSNGQPLPTVIDVDEAVGIAQEAVLATGMFEEIISVESTAEEQNGRPVWVITLGNDERSATVIVDGHTGAVVEMSIKRN